MVVGEKSFLEWNKNRRIQLKLVEFKGTSELIFAEFGLPGRPCEIVHLSRADPQIS